MIRAGFQKKASFQLDFMLKKTPKHKNRLTLFRVKIYAGNKKAYRYGEEKKNIRGSIHTREPVGTSLRTSSLYN